MKEAASIGGLFHFKTKRQMSPIGTSRPFAAPQNLSAIGRWSQRIDATLYLWGKRWSV